MKTTTTIDKFIPFLFDALYFISGFTPLLASKIDQHRSLAVHMTQRVAEFGNMNVWQEQKEKLPNQDDWIGVYSRCDVKINVVPNSNA